VKGDKGRWTGEKRGKGRTEGKIAYSRVRLIPYFFLELHLLLQKSLGALTENNGESVELLVKSIDLETVFIFGEAVFYGDGGASDDSLTLGFCEKVQKLFPPFQLLSNAIPRFSSLPPSRFLSSLFWHLSSSFPVTFRYFPVTLLPQNTYSIHISGEQTIIINSSVMHVRVAKVVDSARKKLTEDRLHLLGSLERHVSI
jgi:hypothetical protein